MVGGTLRTHRLVAVRRYLEDVLRGEDGKPIAGEWPAIVDRDTCWTPVAWIAATHIRSAANSSLPASWSATLTPMKSRVAEANSPAGGCPPAATEGTRYAESGNSSAAVPT